MKTTKETRILILIGAALCVLAIIAGINLIRERKRSSIIWYVEKGLEERWARVLRETRPPESVNLIRVWDGDETPNGEAIPEPGILITTRPRKNREKAAVYYRLSYDLEYQGAIVLAVDPWMVFRKHTDPELTVKRVYSEAGRSGADKTGVLLIPGKDPASVQAWTARLIKAIPGALPAGETPDIHFDVTIDINLWREQEGKLFSANIFPRGSKTYTWQDVFYRLMSSETAWVYAPLSAIRRYTNFRKAILVAAPFPEPDIGRHSLQAALLWAVPLGSPEEQSQMEQAIAWLKKPETQTVIADSLEWIPADPYGKPYDPVSLKSHRNWLTAEYIYEVSAVKTAGTGTVDSRKTSSVSR